MAENRRLTFYSIVNVLNLGNPNMRGAGGHGPAILSANTAQLLQPEKKDQYACSADGTLCQNVAQFSDKTIATLTEGQNSRNRKHTLDKGRRAVCIIQRSCPIFQQGPPGITTTENVKRRDKLPCMGTIYKFKQKLGQI